MKVYNHLYKNKQKFDIFLSGIGIDRSKQALIRIHSAIHSSEEMKALSAEIGELLPNAKIIGCSTPGVILDGKIIPDACLVSITDFDKCEINSIFIDKFKSEKQFMLGAFRKAYKRKKRVYAYISSCGIYKGNYVFGHDDRKKSRYKNTWRNSGLQNEKKPCLCA